MAEQLDKVYDPATIEKQVNDFWSSASFFHPDASTEGDDRQAYTIVIPPPNVTAPLHLGHALNNTLQDILIRFRRMQQRNTLWMPGTDHAGIATQTVVEKRILAEEGRRRTDFDRDEFVARVQAWKDEYEATILGQLKAMGCSCDWQRTRFTMDEVCAKAVRTNFFNLFKDGLIYRGKRLVNWDPATQTVLADDEVEHETVKGHFWYLRYPLVEPVSSMGVPPMSSTAVPAVSNTGILPVDRGVMKRQGARLPHWTQTGATYAVTFRLADSLPANIVVTWKQEREHIEQRAKAQNRELTLDERKELQHLYSARVDSILNSGRGACHLNDERVAQAVQDALKHVDGNHYELIAWAIMPNHVHAVVRPLGEHQLAGILHSWKSFTAKEGNRLLNRTGQFWQEEYYDHLIRDEGDFQHVIEYVTSNPEQAGLRDWPWVGVRTAGQGQDAPDTHGRDAHATDHGQDARATITYVTVATTRPETMLGDTAIAMNPNDPRAAALVGKMVRLPIVGRLIPIVADEHVVLPDPESEDEKAKFSTGFLKVTPAHDPDDYAIGERHTHEIVQVVMPEGSRKDPREFVFINVLAPDGTISYAHGWTDWETIKNADVENLIGLDRFEAREAIIEWFRQENLLEEVRDHTHEVGHSYRSHVPIEPYLSDQWYIAVKKPIVRLVSKFGSGLIEDTDVPVNSLAGLALKPLLDGQLRFIPERYAKTYQTWLENLRDWPISRQLWWGHQIPVWIADFPGAQWVGSGGVHDADRWWRILDQFFEAEGLQKGEDYSLRQYYGSTDNPPGRIRVQICVQSLRAQEVLEHLCPLQTRGQFRNNASFAAEATEIGVHQFPIRFSVQRDPDVLDTWFSSALWPFSTLGWPEETPEMKAFYPGDVLCTAREIITLWVSRMVMMGQYCAGDIPFRDVYIHAMIQDGEGRKMSKSLGNGIDPLVAIDSHGADAMRFTLASMATDTQDIRMPVAPITLPDGREVNTSPKFDVGRNFCNKLWNASRFAMMNLEGLDPAGFDASKMDITDKWILSRLASTEAEVTASLDAFKFSEPLALLYRFFWNDFCDWYLEWVKARMRDDAQRPIAQNVLAFVLDRVLRLLHPFVPFITEGIYQKLNELVPVRELQGITAAKEAKALAAAQWPEDIDTLVDNDAEERIRIVQEVVRAIRDIRNKYNKAPNEKMTASAGAPANTAAVLNQASDLVCQLAGLTSFSTTTNAEKPNNAAAAIVEDTQVYLHDVIDPEAERARLTKQKQETEQAKKGVENKLANENFVTRAKPEVVAQARERLQQLQEQLQAVDKLLAELNG